MGKDSGIRESGISSIQITKKYLTIPDFESDGRQPAWLSTVFFCVALAFAGHSVAQETEPVADEKEPAPQLSVGDQALDCPPPPPLVFPEGGGPVGWRDCADTPELIRLRGGTFLMGAQSTTGTTYELPVREVTVSEFSIGRYEVSFEEFDRCVEAGGCLSRPDDEGWGRGKRPVINVTWIDAQQYVHWLSRKTGKKYRLLSEAEWEYAARAGSNRRYEWGDGAEWVCSAANVLDLTGREARPNLHWHTYCDDGYAFTAPVGSFEPNKWGLYDIHGNVWEWVQDCWHSDYTGAPLTSEPWVTGGDCRKRVNRGGGWGNHPRSMRAASRDADSGLARSDGLGFRVARSP